MRARENTRTLPVIMVTGRGEEAERVIAEGLVSADGFAQRDQPCREEACKPPQLSPSRMPEFTPKPPIPICWLRRCEPQPQRARHPVRAEVSARLSLFTVGQTAAAFLLLHRCEIRAKPSR